MPAKGKQLKTLEIGTNTFANDFTYLGNNPTGGVANDTMAFWRDLGSGYCWISGANQLNNQPYTYGFLLNFVDESNEVHQEFFGAGGAGSFQGHFYRSANASTTAMGTWMELVPSRRLPKSTHYVSANNQSIPNNTNTNKLSWTAPSAGTIIGIGGAKWTTNATGRRACNVLRGGTSIGSSIMGAASVGQTNQQAVFVNRITSGQKLELQLNQTSGGALTCNVDIIVYLIPD